MVRGQKDGRRRDIALGSASKVPLNLARERAQSVREQIQSGIDPVAERRKAAGIPTFREAAKLLRTEHKASCKMKAGREHVVPLPVPALALFERMKVHRDRTATSSSVARSAERRCPT
ncbi:Arm DNA-binding domain-containing protein [Tsuneonella sp. YG55]|uniref:Arm DNA-binding domain-containing protein n=1 Tax=Tsuneonella litorea TaxID=2976475 RepID=A0A9X3A981_9SPHN|nr:Arm DNA-binding domain-containing protein [Tsuneonella litorea]MCT2558630.1 Arm DNA-binding domain-containing protein [Tsuneonella litorea]